MWTAATARPQDDRDVPREWVGCQAGRVFRVWAVVVLLSAALGTGTTVAGSPAGVTYTAPVSPVRVVRPFAPPARRYGRGHLGVDLAVPRGAPVHAAASGVVRFAGSVAGRGLVVVVHPDGISTEYEPLRVEVRTGQTVTPTSVLGRVHGTHTTPDPTRCPPDSCVHWGAKRGGTYLDPLGLLRPLGPVRLLPYP